MEKSVRYYLAKEVPFTLRRAGFLGRLFSTTATLAETEITVHSTEDGSVHKELIDKLRSAFRNLGLSWFIHLGYRDLILDGDRRRDARDKTEFGLTFPLFLGRSNLRKVLGESVALQVEIFDVLEPIAGQQLYGFTTQEMSVGTAVDDGLRMTFEDSTSNGAIHQIINEGQDKNITGKMNLILIEKCYSGRVGDCLAVNKRMLEEELATDAVILPANGAEVKFHRGILAAHSHVFRTMFATDMQEAKTRKIEMPDMSEEGARAFLAFLYHWDLSKAEANCSVALEVLKAAHKYNIEILEEVMRKLFMSKSESWYNVDAALKLFLFVRNLDAEWEPLKKTAVMVTKENNAILKNSGTFQELFQENPEAAMDFHQYTVSVLTSLN